MEQSSAMRTNWLRFLTPVLANNSCRMFLTLLSESPIFEPIFLVVSPLHDAEDDLGLAFAQFRFSIPRLIVRFDSAQHLNDSVIHPRRRRSAGSRVQDGRELPISGRRPMRPT